MSMDKGDRNAVDSPPESIRVNVWNQPKPDGVGLPVGLAHNEEIKLLGVSNGNQSAYVHAPIPVEQRAEVEQAIQSRTLNVEYEHSPVALAWSDPKLDGMAPVDGTNGNRVLPLFSTHGKWNQGDAFALDAEMSTFAVIDFTRNSADMKVVLNECRTYGLTHDDPERHLNQVTVSCGLPSRPADINCAFTDAIDLARRHSINKSGTELDCIDPVGDRIRCRVRRASNGSTWVTPPGRDDVLYDVARVICPSIVFVLLPENDSRLYSWIKMVACSHFGVQTQVIVANRKTDMSKKRKSIALKANAKLSMLGKTSEAWRVEHPGMGTVDIFLTPLGPNMVEEITMLDVKGTMPHSSNLSYQGMIRWMKMVAWIITALLVLHILLTPHNLFEIKSRL